MKITRMGIDPGKSTFHVHAVERDGKVVVEKRTTRRGLARFMRELEPCVAGLEACGGAHHWARLLRGMGHDARLISPQFVVLFGFSVCRSVPDAVTHLFADSALKP